MVPCFSFFGRLFCLADEDWILSVRLTLFIKKVKEVQEKLVMVLKEQLLKFMMDLTSLTFIMNVQV